MDKTEFSKSEMTEFLLMSHINSCSTLDSIQKELLLKLSKRYIDDNNYLFQMYLAIMANEKVADDEKKNVTVIVENNKCTISVADIKADFDIAILKNVLKYLIDICENILPLGSCVELKKKYFQNMPNIDTIESIRVVIAYRFITEGDTAYYTYAGVLYPIGNFNKGQLIRFTPALIENVLSKGFTDVQDDAYIYLMKKELIIENKKLSAGFKLEEE